MKSLQRTFNDRLTKSINTVSLAEELGKAVVKDQCTLKPDRKFISPGLISMGKLGEYNGFQKGSNNPKSVHYNVVPCCAENLNKNTLRVLVVVVVLVVRSHVKYLYEFQPFREGDVNLRTVYDFMFYIIVERQIKISYALRVVKSIMNYLRGGSYRHIFPS